MTEQDVPRNSTPSDAAELDAAELDAADLDAADLDADPASETRPSGLRLAGRDVGVCAWSVGQPLWPTDDAHDPPAAPMPAADLARRARAVGVNHVHLALRPLALLGGDARRSAVDALVASGLVFTAGLVHFGDADYSTLTRARRTVGFGADALWPGRRETLARCCDVAADLGIAAVSMHCGHVPPSSTGDYATLAGRVADAATVAGERGLRLLMETGQERPSDLLQFLHDLPRPEARGVGVNLDAANFVLYGTGDPVEAARTLGEFVAHLHLKDATPGDPPGVEWGREVDFGHGRLGPRLEEFLTALADVGYAGPLVVESTGPTSAARARGVIDALAAASDRLAAVGG